MPQSTVVKISDMPKRLNRLTPIGLINHRLDLIEKSITNISDKFDLLIDKLDNYQK